MQRFHRKSNTPSRVTDVVCVHSSKRCANGAESISNGKGSPYGDLNVVSDRGCSTARPAVAPYQQKKENAGCRSCESPSGIFSRCAAKTELCVTVEVFFELWFLSIPKSSRHVASDDQLT